MIESMLIMIMMLVIGMLNLLLLIKMDENEKKTI